MRVLLLGQQHILELRPWIGPHEFGAHHCTGANRGSKIVAGLNPIAFS